MTDRPTANVTKGRRKLSVFSGGHSGVPQNFLDGHNETKSKSRRLSSAMGACEAEDTSDTVISEWAKLSRVGHVPFNNSKVNQDRVLAKTNCGKTITAHMFGAFDGHGIRGEDVSTFVVDNIMKIIYDTEDFEKDPKNGLVKVFEEMTTALALSSVNCAFSGTTAICSWIQNKTLYTANCGDSRAVLGRENEKGKVMAIALSTDQKPDDPEELKRIEGMNGRVEACKGVLGDPIGPARVWLKTQDMPGLAMSRSFGDDVAASVGVISVPEVTVQPLHKDDKVVIWASDGVWEFITNQEALDIIKDCKNAKDSSRLLVEESTKRWKEQEEVIDDTSCVVLYLNQAAISE